MKKRVWTIIGFVLPLVLAVICMLPAFFDNHQAMMGIPLKPSFDGEYSRVHLSCLNGGLTPETLARIFCLSAKKEEKGEALLEQKIMIARNLIADGILPIDLSDFDIKLRAWRDSSYPAVHHSADFRASYHPAYRVAKNTHDSAVVG